MPAVTPKLRKFYASKEWQRCRKEKLLRARGICEKCGKRGYEIHHVIHLTDENVDDPSISLSLDNLMCLCLKCHNEIHGRGAKLRVRRDVWFDSNGDCHIGTQKK